MRRALSSRIEQLEMAVPMPQPTQLSKEERERRDTKLAIALYTKHTYSSLRHADLSLEQLLTLAKDDDEAEIVRQFEIQILERDAKIDAETALCLRKNLLAHFFASDAAPREPLAELPYTIKFDEAEALNAARLQCPHFDSLSPDGQLEYLEEDLLREQQCLAAARMAAERANATVKERLDASMAELGVIGFDQQIAKLKEKIAERDRTLGPSDREASATHQPRQL